MVIEDIINAFNIYGDLISYKRYGKGHINSTYVSTFNQAGIITKYTHQMINKEVFKKPEQVMHNIEIVTKALKNPKDKDDSRKSLTLIYTKDRKSFFLDEDGNYWRTYLFIDDVNIYEKLDSKELAYKLARKIGEFQNSLAALDASKLYETISRFHDMNYRYDNLKLAIKKDVKGRLKDIKEEVDFLLSNEKRAVIITNHLDKKELPLGITHNDTKLNNILFDKKSDEAYCVIDLDTIMPGSILFDTGDMIRTAVNTADEDERDLSKVKCNIQIFKALIDGYLSSMGEKLTALEKSLLPESGRSITLIMAIRFLTDYLDGDKYYHIDYEDHNLVRAKNQIALVKSMDSLSLEVSALL